MSLVTHGQLELVQIPLGMKPQKRGMVLKPNVLSTLEAIIPGGKGNGFNIQTWGDMTRKYLQPITKLSKENFMKIVQANYSLDIRQALFLLKSVRSMPIVA